MAARPEKRKKWTRPEGPQTFYPKPRATILGKVIAAAQTEHSRLLSQGSPYMRAFTLRTGGNCVCSGEGLQTGLSVENFPALLAREIDEQGRVLPSGVLEMYRSDPDRAHPMLALVECVSDVNFVFFDVDVIAVPTLEEALRIRAYVKDHLIPDIVRIVMSFFPEAERRPVYLTWSPGRGHDGKLEGYHKVSCHIICHVTVDSPTAARLYDALLARLDFSVLRTVHEALEELCPGDVIDLKPSRHNPGAPVLCPLGMGNVFWQYCDACIVALNTRGPCINGGWCRKVHITRRVQQPFAVAEWSQDWGFQYLTSYEDVEALRALVKDRLQLADFIRNVSVRRPDGTPLDVNTVPEGVPERVTTKRGAHGRARTATGPTVRVALPDDGQKELIRQKYAEAMVKVCARSEGHGRDPLDYPEVATVEFWLEYAPDIKKKAGMPYLCTTQCNYCPIKGGNHSGAKTSLVVTQKHVKVCCLNTNCIAHRAAKQKTVHESDPRALIPFEADDSQLYKLISCGRESLVAAAQDEQRTVLLADTVAALRRKRALEVGDDDDTITGPAPKRRAE